MSKKPRRPQIRSLLVALLPALLAWGGLFACKAQKMRPRHMHLGTSPTPTKQKRSTRPQAHKRRQALSHKLLSTLAIARSHHRRATIFTQQQQLPAALNELDLILALRFPTGYRAGEEMLLDAWGRKALLLLKYKQNDRALQVIQLALKRPSWLQHSFYLAQLHHVHGRILAKLKKPKAALQAFQRSIESNKAVIREAQKELSKGSISAPIKPGVPR